MANDEGHRTLDQIHDRYIAGRAEFECPKFRQTVDDFRGVSSDWLFLGDLGWRRRGEERPEQGTQKPFQPAQGEAEVDLIERVRFARTLRWSSRNRKFESISLQRGVRCEPTFGGAPSIFAAYAPRWTTVDSIVDNFWTPEKVPRVYRFPTKSPGKARA